MFVLPAIAYLRTMDVFVDRKKETNDLLHPERGACNPGAL